MPTSYESDVISESKFQDEMLQKVSRTFAFTIPQLPETLRYVVTNAYLLCRIIDTIEDEPALSATQKKHFCHQFLDIAFHQTNIGGFTEELGTLLTKKTIPAEHLLIQNIARVVKTTHSLSNNQRDILERSLKKMVRGMMYYQEHPSAFGLAELKETNRYCYFVAGVIGELLTGLFCDHSPAVARQLNELVRLTNSFGQGLQFTNILKDIWEDFQNGSCWLPRDIFMSYNFDLTNMKQGQIDKGFEQAIKRMVAITCQQLELATCYTLAIPAAETGIRKFCFWNIGMAVLTLQKIYRNPSFSSSEQVKISRNSVKVVVITSTLLIKSNRGLQALFNLWSRGLPREKIDLPDPTSY